MNQTLAQRLFGNSDPIGARVLIGREKERVLEIIGVAADAKMRTLGEDHAPVFFTPYVDPQLLVRTAGNPERWIRPILTQLAAVETASALDVRPLSDATAGAIFLMRIEAAFAGSLSGLGLLLSLAGLYSAVSYAMRRRTREMAIRAAIGAAPSTILWTAIRDGVTVLGIGVAAGLPLAVAAIGPLTDILPSGLNPWSPVMFLTVGILLLITGAFAAWVPARSITGVDPSRALRHD